MSFVLPESQREVVRCAVDRRKGTESRGWFAESVAPYSRSSMPGQDDDMPIQMASLIST